MSSGNNTISEETSYGEAVSLRNWMVAPLIKEKVYYLDPLDYSILVTQLGFVELMCMPSYTKIPATNPPFGKQKKRR